MYRTLLLLACIATPTAAQEITYETDDGRELEARSGGINWTDGTFTPLSRQQESKLQQDAATKHTALIHQQAAAGIPDSWVQRRGATTWTADPSTAWRAAYLEIHGRPWKPTRTPTKSRRQRIAELQAQINKLQRQLTLLLED